MQWRKAVIGVEQFTAADIAAFFTRVDAVAAEEQAGKVTPCLAGRVLANLFYEPSTRTSSSFYAAMTKQGGSVIPINDVNYSSVVKGETLEDTIRTLACYADVIALRHHEDDATERAAKVCPVALINAGNGRGEHPTQALLDLYTIRREQGRLDNLTVTLMGDLKHGRTVHSLAQLLRLFGARLHFVAPEVLQMPAAYVHKGDRQVEHLDEALAYTDVLYMTRVQKERLPEELKGQAFDYVADEALMRRAPPKMTLMHPLPRVNEIAAGVDADPRAAYFRQMKCGLWVRMALLREMLA
jgi:aspartate carbamoyltransferase